jgi:hypothetical protein
MVTKAQVGSPPMAATSLKLAVMAFHPISSKVQYLRSKCTFSTMVSVVKIRSLSEEDLMTAASSPILTSTLLSRERIFFLINSIKPNSPICRMLVPLLMFNGDMINERCCVVPEPGLSQVLVSAAHSLNLGLFQKKRVAP